MTTYQREQVSDVLDEIKPLLELHWREIAHYQDILLEPDYEWYRSHPNLRIYTARDLGRLIGYGVFFQGPNKHYMSSVQSVQDILFVHPEYRRSNVGKRLVGFGDVQAQIEGAQVSYQHVKREHAEDFRPMLEHLGYELVEFIFAKRLDKEQDHGSNSSSSG